MNSVQHILELSQKAKQDFIDSFDLVFFDCDGVVWMVNGAIPHTQEGINLLKDAGKKCQFVSNNSVRSNAEYLQKFKKIGLRDVVEDDIVHPAKTMISYIKTYLPADAKLFSICSETANELFQKNGLNVETLEVSDHLTPPKLAEIVRLRGEKVHAVLCDININLSYPQLARAILFLQQNKECELIIGGSDASIPLDADLKVIGFGQIFDILELQTEREPIKLGKPGKHLYDILRTTFNINDPKRVLFVGDSLEYDIGFAKQCGFQTLLVLTGTATKENMMTTLEYCPDYYADGVFDFVKFSEDLKKV